VRDLDGARELAQFALDETPDARKAEGLRHRLARLDRKLRKEESAAWLWS
jgi:hypothetical protein